MLMAARAAKSSPHLPGLEPTPPVLNAICAVVVDRFAPAALSTRKAGPLSFRACVNAALGLEPGWPAVAHWEHNEIHRFHKRLETGLSSVVGPVEAWVSDSGRKPVEVVGALIEATPRLTGLMPPKKITRRGYLPTSPDNRRYLPEVAIAGIALWWSRNKQLELVDVIGKLGIEPSHTPWEVLPLVDKRIRRTTVSEVSVTLTTNLLQHTRHAIKSGVSISPAPLLWHVAMQSADPSAPLVGRK